MPSKKKDVRMFKALPESLRTQEFSKFKSKLKRWLSDKPFYTLSEYLFVADESGLDSTFSRRHLAEVL